MLKKRISCLVCFFVIVLNSAFSQNNFKLLNGDADPVAFIVELITDLHRTNERGSSSTLSINLSETQRLYIPGTGGMDIISFSTNVSGNAREISGYQNSVHISLDVQLFFRDYLQFRDSINRDARGVYNISIPQLTEMLNKCRGFKFRARTRGGAAKSNYTNKYAVNLVGDNYDFYHASSDYIGKEYLEIYINNRKRVDNGETLDNIFSFDDTDKAKFIHSFTEFVRENKMMFLKKVYIPSERDREERLMNLNLIGNDPPFDLKHYQKAFIDVVWKIYEFESQGYKMEFMLMINPSIKKDLKDDAVRKKQVEKSIFVGAGDSYYMTEQEFANLLEIIDFRFVLKNKNKAIYYEYATDNFIPKENLVSEFDSGIRDYIPESLETINTAIEYDIPFKFVAGYQNEKWSY